MTAPRVADEWVVGHFYGLVLATEPRLKVRVRHGGPAGCGRFLADVEFAEGLPTTLEFIALADSLLADAQVEEAERIYDEA